jgi:dTDP-4-dehydrorhamnose 3,5-epimerase-like enzyme
MCTAPCRGITSSDPDVAIASRLPKGELIVSKRDANAPLLRELAGKLSSRWHP